MNTSEATKIANASTFYRRRAEAMGWAFTRIIIEDGFFGWVLQCDFTCLCNKAERYQAILPDLTTIRSISTVANLLDPARQIYQHGSFSREHLEADGFDPEFIDKVLKIEREYRE